MAKKTIVRKNLSQDFQELISILIGREYLGFKGSNYEIPGERADFACGVNGVELLLVYHRNQTLAGFDRHEDTHA